MSYEDDFYKMLEHDEDKFDEYYYAMNAQQKKKALEEYKRDSQIVDALKSYYGREEEKSVQRNLQVDNFLSNQKV